MNKQSINQVISDLLKQKEIWNEVSPRGLKTKETINAQLYLDPTKIIFSIETKPFTWKYFCGEFKWFLSKDLNIKNISPAYSKFWLKLQNERGEVNSNYGKILLDNHGIQSQLYWVYQSLLKDKFTRQAIAFISEYKYQIEGNLDFPCTIYLNFFIRDDELNMIVRMRSNDIVFGLVFDSVWFSLIQQNLRLLLLNTYPDLKLGTYIHSADNLHFYERHFQILENPKIDADYSIYLKVPFFQFVDGETQITEAAENFMSSITAQDSSEHHFQQLSKLCTIEKN